MTSLVGVYGASGCGRGIMPLIRAQYPRAVAVFIDDADLPPVINGHGCLKWDAFCAHQADEKLVCLAVASPSVREALAARCHSVGLALASVRASNVVEMDDVTIGEGACLSPFVTITSNIRIGRCFHANIYSYVEHDCRIGDFVTLAPGAKINGNVRVGDRAYIGAGAIIRQGLEIGSGAMVGMGAIVTRDIPAGTTVVGNPARPLVTA